MLLVPQVEAPTVGLSHPTALYAAGMLTSATSCCCAAAVLLQPAHHAVCALQGLSCGLRHHLLHRQEAQGAVRHQLQSAWLQHAAAATADVFELCGCCQSTYNINCCKCTRGSDTHSSFSRLTLAHACPAAALAVFPANSAGAAARDAALERALRLAAAADLRGGSHPAPAVPGAEAPLHPCVPPAATKQATNASAGCSAGGGSWRGRGYTAAGQAGPAAGPECAAGGGRCQHAGCGSDARAGGCWCWSWLGL